MTDTEMNEACARKLGYVPSDSGARWHTPECAGELKNCSGQLPNFLSSDEANCKLLDAMAKANAYVWLEWDVNDNDWRVMVKPTTEEDDWSIEYSHPDRRRTVCMAFLRGGE